MPGQRPHQGGDALAHARELRARHPAIQAEYDRLGPRYAAIGALVAARSRAGLSQAELARRMGVSRSVVSRLESGEHDPRLETLVQAARAIGCRVDLRFVRTAGAHR